MTSFLKAIAFLLFFFSFSWQNSFAAYDENTGVENLNKTLQEFWSKEFLELHERPDELLEPLIKKFLVNQKSESKFVILAIDDIKFNLLAAPGLTALQGTMVSVRAPFLGTWALSLKAKIKFNKDSLFKGSNEFTKIITLNLKNIFFESEWHFKEHSPGIFTVDNPEKINLRFYLSLGTQDILSNLLVKVLNPFINFKLNSLADELIREGIKKYYPRMNAEIYGKEQGSLVKETGVSNEELEKIVLNVEKKIVDNHMPHGLLLRAHMNKENFSSWREDYANGGRGIDGQVIDWSGDGDSAIWSGHYLAAEAFRYAVTKDEKALANIKFALSGIDKLLAVNGNTGLLARAVFPLNTPMGERHLKSGEVFRKKMIEGLMWGSYQGGNGVSIDQNLGILFGLSIAFDHLKNHPALQEKCAAMMKLMVDYYISQNWMIWEDRRGLVNFEDPSSPSSWAGANSKVLMILLQILKMYPGDQKYIDEIIKYQGLEFSSWLSEWASSLDQFTSYYKYNLSYIHYYLYFNAEQDPIRRSVVKRAYDIVQRNTEHHLNPHFNLIRLSIDSTLRNQVAPEIEYAIKELVKRAHREGGPKEIDLSGISWAGPFPGRKGTEQKMKLPTGPLDIVHRNYTGYFLWQRSPFEHAVHSPGLSKREKPGIDLTLPYWMARYNGLLQVD